MGAYCSNDSETKPQPPPQILTSGRVPSQLSDVTVVSDQVPDKGERLESISLTSGPSTQQIKSSSSSMEKAVVQKENGAEYFECVYKCLRYETPKLLGILIAVCLYAFMIFFFTFMIFNPRLEDDPDLIIVTANRAVGCYYLIVFVAGFTPPIIILTILGNWSAAPFWNPLGKRWVNKLYKLFAFAWLLWSAIQVWLITLGNSEWHIVSGMCLVIIVFMPFVYTTMFSAYEGLSPRGPHVDLMKAELALGLLVMLMMGLIAIGLHDYDRHKISMLGLCFGAGVPGVFRVFRTLRETLTCRVWHYRHFTAYADVHLDPENLKSMHDVEATYFTLSFCSEGVIVYIVYWLCEMHTDPLAITIALMPIVMCVITYILQKTCLESINVTFSFDYNFKTLSYLPKHPNFENNKHPQSNPDDRGPVKARANGDKL